jgi:hypothetical protein
MEDEIKYLQAQLETENQVTQTIRAHIQGNEQKLKLMAKEREKKRESEI